MYPELEINLHWRDAETYAAMMQFRDPAADGVDFRAEEPELRFEFDKLNALAADSDAYGKLLYQMLFTGKVGSSYQSALQAARTRQPATPLRLRLAIEIAATRLHRCRWETLRDPVSGQSVTTDANIWFSRHLSSFNLKPVRLRPHQAWRVLIGIASPSNLNELPTPLMPIDDAQELMAAQAALDGIGELVPLAGMTLATLETALNEPFDVVYLICHGGIFGKEARLLFEDAEGKFALISGTRLADIFARQLTLPRLVVLCSCQSAGTAAANADSESALVAIGPRLAEIGVPAVVAMHGNLHADTQRILMPRFFRELADPKSGGQVDRALTLARAEAVSQQRSDYWSPVLFSRLSHTGRLWQISGYSGASEAEHAQKMDGIKNLIRAHKCVPILGPGLLEGILGLPSDLARQLVDEADYPLSPTDIEDFPRVAQFLATWMSADGMRQAHARGLAKELQRRWPGVAANGAVANATNSQELQRLLKALWDAKKDSEAPFNLHRILANLRCPLYVNVSGDPFLEWSLEQAGRPAKFEVCPWWHDDIDDFDDDDVDSSEVIVEFTDQTPFVYHLYGRYENPDSLVLTEDDYFRFLLAAAEPVDSRTDKKKSARELSGLRLQVRKNLIKNSLMFIGFRLDNWDFRVILKTLETFGAWASRRQRVRDVVVQVEPDDRFSNPAKAQKYLERFFLSQANIDIYWGSAAEFLQELRDVW